jgi:hypothetical protein
MDTGSSIISLLIGKIGEKMRKGLEKAKIGNVEISVGDTLILKGTKVGGGLYEERTEVETTVNSKVAKIIDYGAEVIVYNGSKSSNPLYLNKAEGGGYRLKRNGLINLSIDSVEVK